MILDGGNRQYEVVRDVFSGKKNEVMVCIALHTAPKEYKTLWKVKDRELTKSLLKMFGAGEEKKVCESWFVVRFDMYFVFPYTGERPLEKFYLSTVYGGSLERQKIWLDLAEKCMTWGLPAGILYLILKQGQIGITPEGTVFFNYFLDLSEYREDVKEKKCAMLCASEILKLVKMEQKGTEIPDRLLEQKLGRKAYTDSFQLYQDMKMLLEDEEKESFKIIKNLKVQFYSKKEIWLKILCVFCTVLFVTAAGTFFFRAFGGGASFAGLLGHNFERIGTESLLQ
ncbi:MAG: hypothetical protein NC307_07840 [Roseburia sp.]|nr:hypothetical protein [Roseburia sp.]